MKRRRRKKACLLGLRIPGTVLVPQVLYQVYFIILLSYGRVFVLFCLIPSVTQRALAIQSVHWTDCL